MKCSRCKNKSVVELRYFKTRFCKRCFIEFFEKRVRRTIRTNKLFNPTDKIAVALSGGKDSVTVLKILKKLSERAPKSEIIAITIDPGIKKNNKKFLKNTKEICKKLGVRHYIYSFKKEFGLTVDEIMRRKTDTTKACTYCGVMRRRLLNSKALKLKVNKIATGHNLDDEVQATMMNLIRGDMQRIARAGAEVGVKRFEGFVPRIKPLRETPEEEVQMYAKLQGFRVNFKDCPYLENAFRNSIRNCINEIEKKHPGSKFQLLKTTDELALLMKKKTTGSIKKCKICGELSAGDVCKVCELKKELGLM